MTKGYKSSDNFLRCRVRCCRDAKMGRNFVLIGLQRLLLLLFSLQLAKADCPTECQCRAAQSGDGTLVTCQYERMSYFPSNMPIDSIDIDFGFNDLTVIKQDFFGSVDLPFLRKINFHNCGVQTVESRAFAQFPALEEIDLSSNQISNLPHDAFQGLPKLRTLYLNKNVISRVQNRTFEGLNLEKLHMEGNKLEAVSAEAFSKTAVSELNLNSNSFTSVSGEGMEPLKSSLRTLYLSNNRNSLSINRNSFSGFTFELLSLTNDGLDDYTFLHHVKAKALDLSGNSFSNIDFSQFEGVKKTEKLILQDVKLESISENMLTNLEGLRELDVSHNDVMFLTADRFRNIPNLRVLKFNHNSLVRLPEKLSRYTPELRELHASTNKITSLDPSTFEGLHNLTRLDVSFNQIQVVASSMQGVFSRVEFLNLAGNPFHCNCEMRWFREWLNIPKRYTGALDCHKPTHGNIWDLQPREFLCTKPNITSMTQNVSVRLGESIFLSCVAQADPAPVVEWSAPFGDVVRITPGDDRTYYKTYAIWEVSKIKFTQEGPYLCSATNVAGFVNATMFVTVLPPAPTQDTSAASSSTTAESPPELQHSTSASSACISTTTVIPKPTVKVAPSVPSSTQIPSVPNYTEPSQSTSTPNSKPKTSGKKTQETPVLPVVLSVTAVLVFVVLVVVIVKWLIGRRHKKNYNVSLQYSECLSQNGLHKASPHHL